jgi:hypothetical protein
MKDIIEYINEDIKINSFNKIQNYLLYQVLGNLAKGETNLEEVLTNFNEDCYETFNDVAGQLFDKMFSNGDISYLTRKKIKK